MALSAVSALAMLYVGAYQIRAIEHMSCPLLKRGCEVVADAPFARPFGIPDGFIAAAMYGLLILLALLGPQMLWARYSSGRLRCSRMCWGYSIWPGSARTVSIACSPRSFRRFCCGWRCWHRLAFSCCTSSPASDPNWLFTERLRAAGYSKSRCTGFASPKNTGQDSLALSHTVMT